MKKLFPVLEYASVPNIITTLGLCFGITACVYLVEGNLKAVLICLALATLMDLIDGFFAVRLKKETQFGKYADSLVDFFICCIMPVFMLKTFVGTSIYIIISSGFYCVCGLWRLANYNVEASAKKQTHFTGLPVPAAMLCVSMAIFAIVNYGVPDWSSSIVLCLTGLMMISSFKLKKYGLAQKILCVVWLIFFIVVLIV